MIALAAKDVDYPTGQVASVKYLSYSLLSALKDYMYSLAHLIHVQSWCRPRLAGHNDNGVGPGYGRGHE